MKKVIWIFSLMLLILSGCVPKTEIESTFYGSIIVSPLVVNNGDEVTLKMGKYVGIISTESSVNGKNIVESIVYFIDGEECASSSDESTDYTTTCILKDVAVGEHKITATCIPSEGVKIEEHITPAKISVIK